MILICLPRSRLRKQISINTGQTINPDLDIHPTGRFTIAPAGSSIDTRTGLPMLSAVHDAEGQALSTITTERLSLLHASKHNIKCLQQ